MTLVGFRTHLLPVQVDHIQKATSSPATSVAERIERLIEQQTRKKQQAEADPLFLVSGAQGSHKILEHSELCGI